MSAWHRVADRRPRLNRDVQVCFTDHENRRPCVRQAVGRYLGSRARGAKWDISPCGCSIDWTDDIRVTHWRELDWPEGVA